VKDGLYRERKRSERAFKRATEQTRRATRKAKDSERRAIKWKNQFCAEERRRVRAEEQLQRSKDARRRLVDAARYQTKKRTADEAELRKALSDAEGALRDALRECLRGGLPPIRSSHSSV
jgi:hypothetical protein